MSSRDPRSTMHGLDTARLLSVVAALALLVAAPLAAPAPDRRVWVGVLVHDGPEYGDPPRDPRVAMHPVAALVDGLWVGNSEDVAPERDEFERPRGPEWEMLEGRLPRQWRGWMNDGRQRRFELAGQPYPIRHFDMTVVATGVRPLPFSKERHAGDVVGVAVAGDVAVRPFADVGGAARDRVSATMRRAMVDAEIREIRERTAGMTSAWYRMAADLPHRTLRAASYSVQVHRVATRANGAKTTVLEAFKSIARTEGCNSLRSGVAIEERQGVTRVIGAWSDLICDELYISYTPLAILERQDHSCWVGEFQYEDGVKYIVQRPGTPDGYSPLRCMIP